MGSAQRSELNYGQFTSLSKDGMFSVAGAGPNDYDPILSIYESEDPLFQQQPLDVTPPPVVSAMAQRKPDSGREQRFTLNHISPPI